MVEKMEKEAIFYHAIAQHAAGSYADISRLKKNFASWEEAYRAAPDLQNTPSPETAYKKLRERGISLVLKEDPQYPPLLREIPHPPFGIYIKGTPPDNDQLTIAIVGTRRATPDGKSTARRFATELARAGISIASGLAFGIDAAAHEGCLDAGGRTIAVLACGLANIYPRNNESVARKILAQGGAIISEYPPDMPAYPSRFLERNRIISGVSKGTLVIESPERSGSLATARFAFEQNRDVFVVPGGVAHPNFKGSNRLIRQGAELVTCTEDVLESYGILKEKADASLSAGTPEERTILKFLAGCSEAADIDKIIDMTKLEPRIANQTVSTLYIKGMIKELGDGYMLN
jgi:DNA processing protein